LVDIAHFPEKKEIKLFLQKQLIYLNSKDDTNTAVGGRSEKLKSEWLAVLFIRDILIVPKWHKKMSIK